MLLNARVVAVTVSELFRENQQEGKNPPLTQIKVNRESYDGFVLPIERDF